MNTRIFIFPLRNDLGGMNIQITDLWPNNSQKNNALDGAGQTFYVPACADFFGPTQTAGGGFFRGSRNTLLDSILDQRVVVDTAGGGNDAVVTPRTTFGLAAYLKDRVPLSGGHTLYTQWANNIALGIFQAGYDFRSLTETAINVIIAAEGGDVLSGGTYDAFGSVTDILRILSGETYVSPANLIFGDEARNFLGLSARTTLVNDATTGTFYAQGRFLTAEEPGFINVPVHPLTGFARASILAGQLGKVANSEPDLTNPAFTYGVAGTALNMQGDNIPAKNQREYVMNVYSDEGRPIV